MKNGSYIAIIAAVIIAVVIFFLPNKTSLEADQQISEVDLVIDSAISLVSEGGMPMQGIMLMRKVLEEHPDNVRAHFQMGLFSIQSGQFEKAVERFEKVQSLDPSNVESLYFLGNAHSNLGNKTEAISYLESFIQKTDDEESRAEVEKIIEQLKNT